MLHPRKTIKRWIIRWKTAYRALFSPNFIIIFDIRLDDVMQPDGKVETVRSQHTMFRTDHDTASDFLSLKMATIHYYEKHVPAELKAEYVL